MGGESSRIEAIETRPFINFVILADRAEVQSGKLYVMGGVIDTFFVASFPTQITFGIGLSIEVPWNAPTSEPTRVRIAFESADGQEVGAVDWPPFTVGRPPTLMPGDSQHIALAVPQLNLTIASAGQYVALIPLSSL